MLVLHNLDLNSSKAHHENLNHINKDDSLKDGQVGVVSFNFIVLVKQVHVLNLEFL